MANSKRKCPNCGTYNRMDDEGVVYIRSKNRLYCDDNCAAEYAIKSLPKVRADMDKKRKSEARKQRLERRANDVKIQYENTKKVLHPMIKLLDKGKPCISCEKPWNDDFHAGHCLTAGGNPEIRFDPRNIHGQCPGCNLASEFRKHKEKTVTQDYKANLVVRYGQDLLDWIEGPHPTAKIKAHQLKEMQKVFRAETKRLQQGLPPSRNWRDPGISLMDLVFMEIQEPLF